MGLSILAAVSPALARDLSVEASLHLHALKKGLIFGACPELDSLSQDQALLLAFLRECGAMTIETFWALIRPTENSFDFSVIDQFVEFALDRNLLVRGHPLIWHLLNPEWLDAKLIDSGTTVSQVEELLFNHISTVVGRYAGKVWVWDVVNEAIEPEDGRSDGLALRPWFKWLGSDYIDLAFWTAAQADPQALLAYNDGGQEYNLPLNEAKRDAALQLLERLTSKGVPIHIFGLQSHLKGYPENFNPDKLRRFLRDVASLGLKIMISELDVIDRLLPADTTDRDRQVASVYKDYLDVVLDEPAVFFVNTWGISDRYTWLAQQEPRLDGLSVRPLPLDDQMNRKPAWYAIAQAFDQCPHRRV
jgi:endo-1,4-beta-xylanase